MLQILLQIVEILVAIVAVIIAILIPVWGYVWNRFLKLETYYEVIWKLSSKLKPQQVLGLRGKKDYGFHRYYRLRPLDQQIEQKLSSGEHLLVVGDPLAGKTRAIFEGMVRSRKKYVVTIPRLVDITNPVDIHIPTRFPLWRIWRKRVVLLDDIDKFAAKQNFTFLLNRFTQKGVIILATCRSGPEFDMLCVKLEKELSLFGDPVEISAISHETAEEVAAEAGLNLPERFDGNIGSIFVPLDTMMQRFKEATSEEKGILRSLKRLHAAGVYRGKDIYSVDRLKKASESVKGVRGQPHQWDGWLEKLKNNGFFEKDKGEVRIEETYLEQVIEDDFSLLANLQQMLTIFANDPDAAFDIGNQAYGIGQVDLQKAELMRVAIEAYDNTLRVRTFANNPEKYAMTQNNLGIAYGMLAEVEETAENCKAAITAFQEALSVRTVDRFPIQYANTQNNLGNAYSMLPEEQDKAANCKLAISAYREALKVRTIFRFRMDYALTQNNLGSAYTRLAEVENKADNCQNAIRAYHEALKVYTLDRFPMDYAMTQNNLGGAYTRLAEVENKSGNCQRAIAAYQEALKVSTLDRLPMQYAMTQNNLGNALRWLAQLENKAENCKKAISACQEALSVHTLDRLPMQYAMTQNNLGNAYRTLARVENKASNCKKAIQAYREALKVRTLDRFPMDYAATQLNLGTAYGTLLDVEDKPGNCKRARKAFEEALKVYTEDFPEPHAQVIHNLEILYRFCEDEPGF